MQCDAQLARFIEMSVQHSKNAEWMQPLFSACLCILCENNATSLLVAKTMVHFYFGVLIKWHDQNERTPFRNELGRIRELIYQFIVRLDDESDVIIDILTPFFKCLNDNPEVIPYDNHGIGEIIGKFFSAEHLDVNIKVLTELLAFGKKHGTEHAESLLRLCANQAAITNGMILIVNEIESVRAKRLALELACDIQRLDLF